MLVKATQSLKDRIAQQIYKLSDSECKTEFRKPALEVLSNMSLGPDSSSILDQLFFGEHLQYRDKLPRTWFGRISKGERILMRNPSASNVNLHSFDTYHRVTGVSSKTIEIVNPVVTAEAPAFIVHAPKEILTPPNHQTYQPRLDIDDPDLHPALRAAYDKAVSVLRIVDKWRAVIDKVNQFLDSTKSVNEAVKLWPELASFLDPEDRERLEKKDVNKKARESRIDEAKKVLASLDTESLVADVVGIKLSAA